MYELRDYQEEAVTRGRAFLTAKHAQHGLIVAPTGCHAAGAPILMFDGTAKAVEDVKVGDDLMGPDSLPRRVLQLCRGRDQMYRVSPKRGGAPFVVNAGHVLALSSTNEGDKKRGRRKSPNALGFGERTFISVCDYIQKSKSWRHLWKLERAGLVEFGSRVLLPINPWMLGALLGDGSFVNGSVSLCTADSEIEAAATKYVLRRGMRVRRKTKPDNAAVDLFFTKEPPVRDRRYPSVLAMDLKALGLLGHKAQTKFIPSIYKTAGADDRRELLAGLLDTDGSHNGSGGFDFISASERLAADVAFVARSLGLSVTAAPKEIDGVVYHRLHITGDTCRILCVVKRKQAPARRQKKNPRVSGFSIERVGEADYFGFTLDSDHLYLAGDFTIHHNSGKSLVIAAIATAMDRPTLVFQPSKEILEQNATKILGYGYTPSVYSASFDSREIGQITLATIGSVKNDPHLFDNFGYVIVDEAHLVNPKAGMYQEFLGSIGKVKILGLTATPFRLSADGYGGSMLKFLTRTRPKVFSEVIHFTQVGDLMKRGYLAQPEYKPVTGFERRALAFNTTGGDYTDDSVRRHFNRIGFADRLKRVTERLFTVGRKSVLIFTRFVDEAEALASDVPGVVVLTGETKEKERAAIIGGFRAGEIKAVANVGVLTTGFDYPELDTVVDGGPTLSLTRYYQKVGRLMRPWPGKVPWFVDMVDNIGQFGKIEDLWLRPNGKRGKSWEMVSGKRLLTNVYFGGKRRREKVR